MHTGDDDAVEPADRDPPTGNAGFASVERAFLRLTFWQTLLSVAGVFTGAVALYAALTESQAVREQTAASVWPYVQFMMDDHGDSESAFFALHLSNVGVGPARMQSMQLLLGERAWRGWEPLASELLEEHSPAGERFGKSDVSSRVLAPGESVTAFQTDDLELASALRKRVYGGEVSLTYCYCSIFDDCWLHKTSSSGKQEPVEVTHCPDYGDRGFMD